MIEIRSYRLRAGSREHFHQLIIQQSLPLMQAWGMDVVAFGASQHDDCSYYLIRAFADLAEMEASQAAFYASPAWRSGPREAIVELIETDSNVVLALSAAAIDALANGCLIRSGVADILHSRP
ncbi:NIPSNAP family protein [Roseateles oligotrophus]|uniref:NIPSNAP family protein n=1 Tax=Roseateles oligotrophus TaxID=1769250 RepID=A0ABT2YD42_9BURK|nr:NIPSNAP family protein [Roseateles oligotrophus]MCV2367968.1 NIPSNAP family protein [Roseateles oligotrophus]